MMKKTIQKPVNWQDFESLCKKLWGEIWECDSITKNGRSGQNQHGVDVFGVPKGQSLYYGIQCKGKDDYTKSKLTKKEIDTEIKKAFGFLPNLKQFIFATTANKDAKIEEYIRIKNIEHISKGDFSIGIFSWEDISDLIEENKHTYDWYVNQINHKVNQNVDLLFENGQAICELFPIFHKSFITLDTNYTALPIESFAEEKAMYSSYLANINKAKRNLSFSKISMVLVNSGTKALEEIMLKMEIENNFGSIGENNIEYSIRSFQVQKISYLSIKDNLITYKPIVTQRNIIPKDCKTFEFYIKPRPEEYTLKIKWHFLSKDYDKTGENILNIKPKFKNLFISKKPESNEKDGDEQEDIEDFYEVVE